MSNHLFQCSSCKVTYSVSSRDTDLRLLKTVVLCPNQPCKGRVREVASTNLKVKSVRVKAIELYQAHHKGFASERKCGPKTLTKILKGSKVRDVDIDAGPDPDKSVLRSITLENGKTLHLAPSTLGVVVIKVTENRDVR